MTWSSGSGRYGCIAIVWPRGWIRRLGARRHVGALLDLNPAMLRNWVEDGERVEGLRVSSVAVRPAGPQEVRALKKRIAELERANERSSRPVQRFSLGGVRPPTGVIVAYIDAFRGRFDLEPICAVLTEHGITIAPSTYHARTVAPVSPAALQEAYLVYALSHPVGRGLGRVRGPQTPSCCPSRWPGCRP